jgi:hypothetical protein
LSKFLRAFRELLSSERDEVFGRHAEVLSGSEIGSLSNIERQEGMDTVDHVVGGIAGRLPNGNTFGPEDLGKDFAPLGLVTFAGLHDSFANVKVLRLHDTVGARVVARDANVMDAVAGTKNFQSSDVRGSVVSNQLFKTTPATENILEDEVGDNFARIGRSSASLGIGGQSIASVMDVAVGTKLRHEEGIDVGFSEEGGDERNDRRDVEVLHLAQLTLVTRLTVPTDVFVKVRPPEAKQKVIRGRESTFVSELVVGVGNESKTVGRVRDELNSAVAMFPKELLIHEEEFGGLPKELTVFVFVEVRRSLQRGKELANGNEFVVAPDCSNGARDRRLGALR